MAMLPTSMLMATAWDNTFASKLKHLRSISSLAKMFFKATQESVYHAIADHIVPCCYKPDAKSSRQDKEAVWIHPFEIITIGGDDVLLIVPANKAMEVAQAIGTHFEALLVKNRSVCYPKSNFCSRTAASASLPLGIFSRIAVLLKYI